MIQMANIRSLKDDGNFVWYLLSGAWDRCPDRNPRFLGFSDGTARVNGVATDHGEGGSDPN